MSVSKPVPEHILALPCWVGEVAGQPLHGGLSNESWKITDDAGAHVVRLGKDYPFHHVDRARELMVARAAHAAGFGPKVEYAAPGVMVAEFLEGRTWDAADVCANPERIGHLLRDFHQRMAAGITGAAFLFWPFHVIRDYARTIQEGGSAFAPDTLGLLDLCAQLEATQPALPLIFGHHDLLPANFIEAQGRLWLIDFEYAGFGTCLFDLAGVASNAGMDGDQTGALTRAYMGRDPEPGFARAFDAMAATSLLREAMWAMVSDLHLSAPGADYQAYARDNLAKLDASLATFTEKHGAL